MCYLQVNTNHFNPILRFQYNLFGNDKHRKTAPLKEVEEKVAMALRIAGLLESRCAPIIQYSYQRFCITKPSHVTIIHWKFEDFLPSSLGVIKVWHISIQFNDGV